MQHLLRRLIACGLPLALAFQPSATRAATTPSQLIPDKAAICFEMLKPGPVVDALLSPGFSARLKSVPTYEAFSTGPKLQDLRSALGWLETSVHTNWQTMLRTVTRQNAAIAFGAGNRHLLVLTGDDPEMLRSMHDFTLQIAKSEAEKRGQSDQVRSMDYAGLTGWTFNGQEAHTLNGAQLLAGSDAEVLKAAVDLRDSNGAGSLAGRADYKAARKAVGPDANGMLFLDLEQLRGADWFKNLIKGQQQNPLTSLLFADLPEALQTAHWLALGIYVDASGLILKAYSDAGKGTNTAASFASIKGGSRGLAASLTVPRQIALLNLHRDLAGFYAAKDALFPERTSGLIFFENMMGIFFSGRNLTDEVLSETQPQVQMVVARQEYDPAIGIPEPQLPAFAFVFGLRHPDAFGEVVEEAWQKALGLINFTRGQKAEPGLILDRAEHKGYRITLSKFSAKDIEDRSHIDQRFNFRPSLALAKGCAILSSTDQLARDLLDALDKAPAAGTPSAERGHSLLRLSGTELAGILRANRMSLVRGNMVKDGKTQPEAEAAMDTLTALAGWADRATLSTGNLGPGQIAELRLSFSQP